MWCCGEGLCSLFCGAWILNIKYEPHSLLSTGMLQWLFVWDSTLYLFFVSFSELDPGIICPLFHKFNVIDLQESCLTWSPPGPRGPSHIPKLLCPTSFGKSLKDPGTRRLLHGHLRAWPTPNHHPRGAETPWAWWLDGAARTPQVAITSILCG